MTYAVPPKPRLSRAMAVLGGAPAPDMSPSAPPEPGIPSTPSPEAAGQPGETGGPKGPEPTRYGDWERKGRCIDF
jgi:hypothetical protein